MTTLAEPIATDASDYESSPADVMATADTAEQVLGWLDRLPDNQREVIRLKFQNGLKYRQIAEITGQSVNYVGFLIHKGIKSLREKAARLRSEE